MYMPLGRTIVEGLGTAEKFLRSNKAINTVYELFDRPAAKIMGEEALKASVARAMGDISQYTAKDAIRFGMQTYAGLSIANRAIFGGSIIRDSNGDFDIVGIPIL